MKSKCYRGYIPFSKKLKESTLEYIEDTEHTYLSRNNITKKLRDGSLLGWIASIVIFIRQIRPDCYRFKRKLSDLSFYQSDLEEEKHNPPQFLFILVLYLFFTCVLFVVVEFFY